MRLELHKIIKNNEDEEVAQVFNRLKPRLENFKSQQSSIPNEIEIEVIRSKSYEDFVVRKDFWLVIEAKIKAFKNYLKKKMIK